MSLAPLSALALALAATPAAAKTFVSSQIDGRYDARLYGVWQSPGYGEIAEITPDGLSLYHTAGGVCLADDGEADMAALFAEAELTDSGVRFREAAGTTRYDFQRLAALPTACSAGTPTPEQRFQFLTATFADLYPSFERRSVDWPAAVAAVRAQYPVIPSDAMLWQAVTPLFTALNDPHSGIAATFDGEDHSLEPGEAPTLLRVQQSISAPQDSRPEKVWLDAYRTGILTTLLKGQGHHVANSRIFWGRVDDIGYINIVTMGAFGEDDQAVLAETLDEALTAFAGTKAVVVDVSNNRGGYDDISRAIAQRFVTTPALAFTKQPAADPQSPLQEFRLEPAPELITYTGPVYLVTSDITVSAGESFTLYMKSQPQVVQVGARTRGAFSDQIEKPLGAGWHFSLSAEIYRDPKGNWYEGQGLTPDVALDIYAGPDLLTNHARALTTLFGWIRSDDPQLKRQ